MRFLPTVALCLLSTAGFAQAPQPSAPPRPGPEGRGLPPAVLGTPVTQSSRVRAFNAAPDGRVRSLYLSNGSVVDLSSNFGPAFNAQIHKGARVQLTGTRTVVNGQTILVPQQLTVDRQSFLPQPGPDVRADVGRTDGPGAGPGAGPRGPKHGPKGGPKHGPGADRAGLKPPPPDAGGPRPPAPDGGPGPLPPASSEAAGQVPPPPPHRGHKKEKKGPRPEQPAPPSPGPNVQPAPASSVTP